MATFNLDVLRATRSLAAFNTAPERSTVVDGGDLAQGLVWLMYGAETVAADAGHVPTIEVEVAPGITRRAPVTVGGARGKIEALPEGDPVRTLYLASHGIARRTHFTSQPSTASLAEVRSGMRDADEIGAVPLLVPLLVLGVAAIVAGAYYATETAKTRVEVDGQNLRAAGRTAAVLGLASTAIKAGQPIPPEVWSHLRDEAQIEAQHREGGLPWGWLVGGGVVALAAVYGLSRLGPARGVVVYGR